MALRPSFLGAPLQLDDARRGSQQQMELEPHRRGAREAPLQPI
ncbi:MAG: hypothetical protein PHS14_02735 [Elusimicrobia bacterium]|nr:hypothetical protein [Elusimicrobiota bacterium]